MLPIIHIGPLAIQAPGLVILAGIWIGLAFAEREAVRLRVDPDVIYGLVITCAVAAFAGARLLYVVRFWDAFRADPLGIVIPSLTGLDPVGGTAAIGIAVLFRVGKSTYSPQQLADTVAPLLAILAIALGLAHFAAGDAFGAPARLPWSIYIWGEYRHPSQLYEIMAGLLVFVTWHLRKRKPNIAGTRFTLVAGALCVSVIFLEAFRGDSLVMAGGIRTTQAIATALLGAVLTLALYWSRKEKAADVPVG